MIGINMGLLIEGTWHDQWYDTKGTGGAFQREQSSFRNWITADGSAGPSGEGGFRAEPNRYHLFISFACPWAHRTSIYRTIKGLESVISMSTVSWLMRENGWVFESGPGGDADPILGARCLWELYVKANPDYTGRVTVPILWDRQRGTIVSNESSEIIRMFDESFSDCGAEQAAYRPAQLRTRIHQLNDWIYRTINNGVYKAGFATEQAPYESAVRALFKALGALNTHLEKYQYLLGPHVTEADWRLVTTLIRFDPVYVTHFKCTLHRLTDYPALWAYTQHLSNLPGVSDTIRMDHIKGHYYQSHPTINPYGLVPLGPNGDSTVLPPRSFYDENVPSEHEIQTLCEL